MKKSDLGYEIRKSHDEEPLPANAYHTFAELANMGAGCAAKWQDATMEVIKRSADEYLDTVLPRKDEDDISPINELGRAAFWYGVWSLYWQIDDRVGIKDGIAKIAVPGARIQRHLLSGLLGVPDRDRNLLFQLFSQDEPQVRRHWRSCYFGAIASARVARGFHEFEIYPHHATANVDISFNIDFLAPIEDAAQHLLCIQIKNKGAIHPFCRIARWSNQDRGCQTIIHSILKHFEEFTHSQQRPCVPVVIVVGHGNETWDIKPPPSLIAGIRSVLEEIRTSPAR